MRSWNSCRIDNNEGEFGDRTPGPGENGDGFGEDLAVDAEDIDLMAAFMVVFSCEGNAVNTVNQNNTDMQTYLRSALVFPCYVSWNLPRLFSEV